MQSFGPGAELEVEAENSRRELRYCLQNSEAETKETVCFFHFVSASVSRSTFFTKRVWQRAFRKRRSPVSAQRCRPAQGHQSNRSECDHD
jgi:hypothetical protein